MGALDGLVVLIKDIRAKIYSWPIIICGVDSNGNPVPFGASPASGGGGGGIPIVQSGSALPYGADEMTVTSQVAAGPHIILFKVSGATVKTRTISYTNAGVGASDTITDISDT